MVAAITSHTLIHLRSGNLPSRGQNKIGPDRISSLMNNISPSTNLATR